MADIINAISAAVDKHGFAVVVASWSLGLLGYALKMIYGVAREILAQQREQTAINKAQWALMVSKIDAQGKTIIGELTGKHQRVGEIPQLINPPPDRGKP